MSTDGTREAGYSIDPPFLTITATGKVDADAGIDRIIQILDSLDGGPHRLIIDIRGTTWEGARSRAFRRLSKVFDEHRDLIGTRRAIVADPGLPRAMALIGKVTARVWHGADVGVVADVDEARRWLLTES